MRALAALLHACTRTRCHAHVTQVRALAWMLPVTKTRMPPETDGWKSLELRCTLHAPNASCPIFCMMAVVPMNLLPSNVSMDCSWYSVPSAGRLLSKSW